MQWGVGAVRRSFNKKRVIARRNDVAIPDKQVRSVSRGLPRCARNDVLRKNAFLRQCRREGDPAKRRSGESIILMMDNYKTGGDWCRLL